MEPSVGWVDRILNMSGTAINISDERVTAKFMDIRVEKSTLWEEVKASAQRE